MALYERLSEIRTTPVVALNRAVAVAMADGPAAGLALLVELERQRKSCPVTTWYPRPVPIYSDAWTRDTEALRHIAKRLHWRRQTPSGDS